MVLTPMSNQLTLHCWVFGTELPSHILSIEISGTDDFSKLRKLIKDDNPTLLGRFDTLDLTLWKVSIPTTSESYAKLSSLSSDDISTIGLELDPMREISSEFEKLDRRQLHIIVQPPASISPSKSEPKISSDWSARQDTVVWLYKTLLREKLVYVRGTPGSGKTTLMNLLHAYIKKHTRSEVRTIFSWPWDSDRDNHMNLPTRLKMYMDDKYPRTGSSQVFLLFDEGQETYRDVPLWNSFLKGIGTGDDRYRAILFCSYGSASSTPAPQEHVQFATPPSLRKAACISLHPTADVVGLLLTRSEFDEVVSLHRDRPSLDPHLTTLIFEYTAGHVGAVVDILSIISSQKKAEIRRGEQLSVTEFHRDFPIHELMEKLNGGNFKRGLPRSRELRDGPALAALFRSMLRDGFVTEGSSQASEIDICHLHGWIHSFSDPRDITHYTFASPLHKAYISWILEPTDDMPVFHSIIDLSFMVIAKFKRSQLQLPTRRVQSTESDVHPPEAQYQQEFYRCLFNITNGNVRISPEFASAKGAKVAGRIDFFIPKVGWGIEITRDGGLLAEHDTRFQADGAYGAWLLTGDMSSYILLDFRTVVPRKRHPNIQNLVHVVFEDSYQKVTVYDNTLNVLGAFQLQENHL